MVLVITVTGKQWVTLATFALDYAEDLGDEASIGIAQQRSGVLAVSLLRRDERPQFLSYVGRDGTPTKGTPR